jgi:hypothetical protein
VDEEHPVSGHIEIDFSAILPRSILLRLTEDRGHPRMRHVGLEINVSIAGRLSRKIFQM